MTTPKAAPAAMTRQPQAHTAGPWHFKRDDYQKGAWNIGPYAGETVCRLTGRAGIIEQAEANARLIAAAPGLLAALENLLTYDRVERPAFRAKPEGAPNSDVRIRQDKLIALEDAARAAIKKATQP